MKFKSKRSKRIIELLDEDDNYFYFYWLDYPNTICQYSKKCEEKFNEYFQLIKKE